MEECLLHGCRFLCICLVFVVFWCSVVGAEAAVSIHCGSSHPCRLWSVMFALRALAVSYACVCCWWNKPIWPAPHLQPPTHFDQIKEHTGLNKPNLSPVWECTSSVRVRVVLNDGFMAYNGTDASVAGCTVHAYVTKAKFMSVCHNLSIKKRCWYLCPSQSRQLNHSSTFHTASSGSGYWGVAIWFSSRKQQAVWFVSKQDKCCTGFKWCTFTQLCTRQKQWLQALAARGSWFWHFGF